MIRVVLVDDHELVRVGMEYVFNAMDDIEVVGGAADGEAVLAVVRDSRPAVVLMDLAMPNDGIEALRRLTRSMAATRVVAFTTFTTATASSPRWMPGQSATSSRTHSPTNLPRASVLRQRERRRCPPRPPPP